MAAPKASCSGNTRGCAGGSPWRPQGLTCLLPRLSDLPPHPCEAPAASLPLTDSSCCFPVAYVSMSQTLPEGNSPPRGVSFPRRTDRHGLSVFSSQSGGQGPSMGPTRLLPRGQQGSVPRWGLWGTPGSSLRPCWRHRRSPPPSSRTGRAASPWPFMPGLSPSPQPGDVSLRLHVTPRGPGPPPRRGHVLTWMGSRSQNVELPTILFSLLLFEFAA